MAPQNPLRNSVPGRVSGSRSKGRLHDTERLRVSVVLKPSPLGDDHPLRAKLEDLETRLPGQRTSLSDAEIDQLAPHPEYFSKVEAFAREYGLDVVEVSPVPHQNSSASQIRHLHAELRGAPGAFLLSEGVLRRGFITIDSKLDYVATVGACGNESADPTSMARNSPRFRQT